ncbi:hypothetical protein [Pseudofrankia sp. BMG5.36]|uniref:hypothetical protein n=1 Tax=Pseudofrankia sp. BMG5.36 TaxID=1834512 RepID=UPI000A922725|nr:hypothetical protein [Pseudofrankia sp. BMG5.36]
MADVTEWATRRLALVIVATMVLTTAVALPVGVLLGRHSTPGDNHQPLGASTRPASLPPATATVAVVPSPTSAGVDHTAEPAGALPGTPSRVNEFGIPVGYPHTEAGAISACGNYVSAYSDVRNREPSRIRPVLNSIATGDTGKQVSDRIIKSDQDNIKAAGANSITDPSLNFNLRVVGFSTKTSSRDSATISIWSVGGIGIYGNADQASAPQEFWGSDDCTVRWENGDWRLSAAVDGPGGPTITQRPGENFRRFSYIGGPST